MGNTPLMTAIIAGNAVVLKHMFETINGCTNTCYKDILFKNNEKILIWAIQNKHVAIIQVSTPNWYWYIYTLTIIHRP